MSSIGDREITTQQRVIRFSPDTLDYRYLGDRKGRDANSTINGGAHCRMVKIPTSSGH